MSMGGQVDYEVLSRDTVAAMHQKFMKRMEEKAKKAIPSDIKKPDKILEALEEMLIAFSRKAIEIKADELAKIAKAGKKAIQKRIKEAQRRVHTKSPLASNYPSPALSRRQKLTVFAAAATRNDRAEVQKIFGNEDRIYLRLKESESTRVNSPFQQQIAAYLEQKGYHITDYSKGYATDAAGKQQFKIGKLLKDNDRLYKGFMDDSTRTLGTLLVVVSRNPTDIATMSTGRAWSSCMGSGGFNWKYVPRDVRKGSLVAYLVSEKDPDIVSPLTRILIKPFREKKPLPESKRGKLAFAAQKAFQPHKKQIFVADKAYGLASDAFSATVKNFIEENLNTGKVGDFRLARGLYADGIGHQVVRRTMKVTVSPTEITIGPARN